jgi:hypothetical protein
MKDRSAALVMFGALQILLGVCALCVLFGFAAAIELQSRGSGVPAPPLGAIVSNVVFYSVLAVYFFSAGIGSIRKRRWARALSLVVSALWLVAGFVSIVAVAIIAPRITAVIPPSQTTIVLSVIFIALGVLGVVLPLVLVLFYRGPNVKATVEAADPTIRWTDRVPLPILALVLVMAYASLSMLSFATYGVLPLFSMMLTGPPAIIIVVALAGLFAFLTVQLYRLKRSAWWTLVLLQVIGGAAGAWAVTRTDMEKLYEQMGIMTPQIRAMHLVDLYRDPLLWAFMAVCWTATMAYLLWVRRLFDSPPPRTRASD